MRMADAPYTGDLTSRLDQIRAEQRGVAQMTRDYMRDLSATGEFTEEQAFVLAADWHRAFWSSALADVGPSAARGAE